MSSPPTKISGSLVQVKNTRLFSPHSFLSLVASIGAAKHASGKVMDKGKMRDTELETKVKVDL